MRNKSSFTTLLLAGAAAYAYYKYSKMTPEERKSFVGNLKQKGKDLMDEYMPGSMKSGFNRAASAGNERFGDGNDYTS
ncbi:MAG TPA: hypothetical protein VLC28_04915 [Flavitalea sp.]|nr:hypothetical protein [Flavitalea sp.]